MVNCPLSGTHEGFAESLPPFPGTAVGSISPPLLPDPGQHLTQLLQPSRQPSGVESHWLALSAAISSDDCLLKET